MPYSPIFLKKSQFVIVYKFYLLALLLIGCVWTAHIQSYRGWRIHQCIQHQPNLRGHNSAAVTVLSNFYPLYGKSWLIFKPCYNSVEESSYSCSNQSPFLFYCSCEYVFRMEAVPGRKLWALWHWQFNEILKLHALSQTVIHLRSRKMNQSDLVLDKLLQQMLTQL